MQAQVLGDLPFAVRAALRGRAMVGPVFFEFIQRQGDEGFGEGNIAALFRSMEEDQLRRGTLTATDSEG